MISENTDFRPTLRPGREELKAVAPEAYQELLEKDLARTVLCDTVGVSATNDFPLSGFYSSLDRGTPSERSATPDQVQFILREIESTYQVPPFVIPRDSCPEDKLLPDPNHPLTGHRGTIAINTIIADLLEAVQTPQNEPMLTIDRTDDAHSSTAPSKGTMIKPFQISNPELAPPNYIDYIDDSRPIPRK